MQLIFMKPKVGFVRPKKATVACLMSSCHVRCVKTLADASYHWKISPGRCMQVTTDVPIVDAHTPWQKRATPDLYCHQLVYVA